MTGFRDILDGLRPRFESSRARPVFEAFDEACYTSPLRASGAPHFRDPVDIKRYMTLVIAGVLPAVACSVHFFGPRVLALIAVSYAVGGAAEVTFAVVRKHGINEGFLVTGLLFPMTLPPGAPLWMAAVGVLFGVIMGKEVFGGTGRNVFNPALVGRAFLAIAYPAQMSAGYLMPGAWRSAAEVVTSATPLEAETLAPLARLFWGGVPGSIGETSKAAILVGAALVLATRAANWRTVASVFAGAAVAACGFHLADPARFAPVEYQLLAGGLAFGAVFMATDPVSGPLTNAAKYFYGAMIGVVAIVIRCLTGYSEGAMFAILLGNVAAPLFDEAVVRMRMKCLKRQMESAP